MVHAEGLSPDHLNHTPANLAKEEEKLVASVLSWDKPERFEDVYAFATIFETKLAIATALIKDGRYEKPDLLVRYFIPPGRVLDPALQQQGETLKAKLQQQVVELIGQNIVKGDSKVAIAAQHDMLRYIDEDPSLQILRDQIPIHVFNRIATIHRFAQITDWEKRQELLGWTTRSLLSPYLGDLLTRRTQTDLSFSALIQNLPDKVISDADAMSEEVIRNYFTGEAFKLFRQGEEAGFEQLTALIAEETNPVKKHFLSQIQAEIISARDEVVPESLVDTVTWNGGEGAPFPHLRQKWFVHEFLKSKRKLLNGDTGATKTACTYYAFEKLGVKKALVIGPALARDTWVDEAKRLFKEGQQPEVFALRSAKDIDDKRLLSANVVYISSAILAKAEKDKELRQKFYQTLVVERGTDAVAMDESDEFRTPTSARSKVASWLVSEIDQAYARREDKPHETMPMVALTATPLSTSLKDLNIPLALLYPERFALPKQQKTDSQDKPVLTFYEQSLRNPEVAFSLLYGDKLMLQWTQEDLFGEDVQTLKFSEVDKLRERLTLSLYERVIYRFLEEQDADVLVKARLLSTTLLNPELIREFCRNKGWVPQNLMPREALEKRFLNLYDAWTHWALTFEASGQEIEPFSAEWIAAQGEKDFLLSCFFGEVGDIDVLASQLSRQHTSLEHDWQAKEAVSTKYAVLQKLINASFPVDEQGNYIAGEKPSRKIAIISPFNKRGVTRWLEDPRVKDTDLTDDTWSLYELICSDWVKHLPSGMAVNIDGDRSFAKRKRDAQLWREDGEQVSLIVATMASIYESMNWAPLDTESNQNIGDVLVVNLSWPWGFDEYKQMSGRFLRPGLGKNVRLMTLEVDGTVDQGFYDLVRYKYLLSQLALSGITLTDEEKAFFKSTQAMKKVIRVRPSEGQLFIQHAVKNFKNAGEKVLTEQLARQHNGKDYYRVWAESYFEDGRDEFRPVGNNAELMSKIALSGEVNKALSIGAGTALFARKLRQAGFTGEIDNLDLNGEVLSLADAYFPDTGRKIVGLASELSGIVLGGSEEIDLPDNSYDFVDLSFVLDLTNLYDRKQQINSATEHIDRVKVLSQMNRVMKPQGRGVISVPFGAVGKNEFINITKALSAFGFSLVPSQSGIVWGALDAEDRHQRRVGWVFTVEKTGEVDFGLLNPSDLTLLGDLSKVSRKKGQRSDSSGVVEVDSPYYISHHFMIRNPLTNERLFLEGTGSQALASYQVTSTNGHHQVATPQESVSHQDKPADSGVIFVEQANELLSDVVAMSPHATDMSADSELSADIRGILIGKKAVESQPADFEYLVGSLPEAANGNNQMVTVQSADAPLDMSLLMQYKLFQTGVRRFMKGLKVDVSEAQALLIDLLTRENYDPKLIWDTEEYMDMVRSEIKRLKSPTINHRRGGEANGK